MAMIVGAVKPIFVRGITVEMPMVLILLGIGLSLLLAGLLAIRVIKRKVVT